MQPVQVSASSRHHPSSFSGARRCHLLLLGRILESCSSQALHLRFQMAVAGRAGGRGYSRTVIVMMGFFLFCFQELSKTQMSISGDVFIAAALLFPVIRICGRAAAVNVPQLLPGTLLPCSAASGATSATLSAGYQFFIRTKVKAEQRKRPPWTAVTNSQPAEGPSEAPPLTGTNGELVCSDLLRSASWKVQRRSRGDGFISSHLRFNTHPHFLFGVPAKRSEGQTGGGAAGRTDGWTPSPLASLSPVICSSG